VVLAELPSVVLAEGAPGPTATVFVDMDGDGQADCKVVGADLNNDGIPDVLQEEGCESNEPGTATVLVDVDGDGQADFQFTGVDLDHDGIPDVLQADRLAGQGVDADTCTADRTDTAGSTATLNLELQPAAEIAESSVDRVAASKDKPSKKTKAKTKQPKRKASARGSRSSASSVTRAEPVYRPQPQAAPPLPASSHSKTKGGSRPRVRDSQGATEVAVPDKPLDKIQAAAYTEDCSQIAAFLKNDFGQLCRIPKDRLSDSEASAARSLLQLVAAVKTIKEEVILQKRSMPGNHNVAAHVSQRDDLEQRWRHSLAGDADAALPKDDLWDVHAQLARLRHDATHLQATRRDLSDYQFEKVSSRISCSQRWDLRFDESMAQVPRYY